MSSELQEIEVTGLISKVLNTYIVTTDNGTEYTLSAISPWESVSSDYNSGQYVDFLGHRMVARGQTDGSTIWGASLASIKTE
ncbi:MAG: hypothetical protein ACTSUO_03055 [Candidatus Thorarchaeota archaeon]